jgi:hypothetical protein
MKDNCVGPSNVPHEHLKFVKKSGNNSRGIVFFHVVSVSILFVKYYPCLQQFNSSYSQAQKEWQQRSKSVLLRRKKKNLSNYKYRNARKWLDALLATEQLTVNQRVL